MARSADTLYITLDAIIDTRMGTLEKMNPQYALSAIDDNYLDRDGDWFKGVNREEYLAAYKARDVVTLQKSYVTNIFPMVRHFLRLMAMESLQSPEVGGAHLQVNVWPYKLTDDQREYYREAIGMHCHEAQSIDMIDVAPQNLSIAEAVAKYKIMIDYCYEEWLESRAEELKETRAPNVLYFTPAIYHVERPTQKQLETMRNSTPSMHPFEASEFEVHPFLSVHFLDIRHFSLVDPRTA